MSLLPSLLTYMVEGENRLSHAALRPHIHTMAPIQIYAHIRLYSIIDFVYYLMIPLS